MDPSWQQRLRDFREFSDVAPVRTRLGELLEDLLAQLQRMFAAHTINISLLEGDELVLRASRGLEEQVARGTRVPGGRGLEGRIAGSREPVRIHDLATVDLVSPALRERDVKSLLGASLRRGDRLLGVMHVGSMVAREWTDAEAWLLQNVADRVAAEIEHVRIHEADARAVDQMLAAQERYRSVAEGLDHTIVWEADLPRLRITYISPQAEGLLHVPHGEWTKEGGLVAQVPEPERGAFTTAIEACAAGACDQAVDHHFVGGDGRLRWFHTGMRVVTGGYGEPLLRGISVDLSRIKAAEEALREREEHFRLLVEGVDRYAIFGVDPDGRISSWNAGGERLFGYSEGEILGRPRAALYFPDHGERQADELLAARRLGSLDVEGPRRRKDGVEFLARSVLAALLDDGRLRGYAEVLQDVTDERRRQRRQQFLADVVADLAARAELQPMLHRFADRAVPALADACVVDAFDDDGALRPVAVAHVDPGAAATLSALWSALPADAPLGAAWAVRTGDTQLHASLLDDDGATSRARAAREALRAAGVTALLTVPLIAHGRPVGAMSLFTIAASGRRLDDDDLTFAGEVGGRAALLIDNARLRHEAEAANRRKDAFLAVFAHELRNPLGSIAMAVELLDRLIGDDVRTAAPRGAIRRQAQGLTRLVDDLLDVARIERGKLKLERTRLDLRDVAGAACELHRGRAEARRQSFAVDLGAAPLPVDADAVRFEQVIGNLLENAIKYTPEGGHIWVEASRAGDDAVLCVRDDGCGIAADLLPRVFDLFSQADRAATRRSGEGGLGVGLALARQVTELHGGTISATSPGPGGGSRFEVRLPLAREATGHAAPAGA